MSDEKTDWLKGHGALEDSEIPEEMRKERERESDTTSNRDLRETVKEWRKEATALREKAPHDMCVEHVQANVREEKANEIEELISDEDVERGRHVGETLLGAAIIVGFVLGFIVLIAWGFGYPGFNKYWLTNVVAPTYVTVTVLVAGFWLWLDASRRRRITNDE